VGIDQPDTVACVVLKRVRLDGVVVGLPREVDAADGVARGRVARDRVVRGPLQEDAVPFVVCHDVVRHGVVVGPDEDDRSVAVLRQFVVGHLVTVGPAALAVEVDRPEVVPEVVVGEAVPGDGDVRRFPQEDSALDVPGCGGVLHRIAPRTFESHAELAVVGRRAVEDVGVGSASQAEAVPVV